MKILILGASGFVGNTIFNVLDKDHDVYGTYFSQIHKYADMKKMYHLDISKYGQIEQIMEETSPQVIISCLRGDFQNQLKIHRKAAEYIYNLSGSKLIYLSTANVFDALDTSSHTENEAMSSESEYGNFKISCENTLTEILGEKAIIIRIPFIWGKDSPRLKKLILDIQNGASVTVWSNLLTNHTTDIQIAAFTQAIIDKDMKGIFHVGSDKPCSYVEFIKALILKLQLPMPVFEFEELPYKSYLAVLSGRSDIPAPLKMTNKDIINYLSDFHNQC